ncbi:hypothetical protein Pcinc_017763 [Petrolisthes cinctipes]|uniref:Uncharacterized protein n=1 Tax=Petrolisthes cinctipes TaxID=88211 RepID=A0AAE1FQ27_PETCI|nr:hypothetical protein Pcinc_017763 [Petrolisthes cinctipes]
MCDSLLSPGHDGEGSADDGAAQHQFSAWDTGSTANTTRFRQLHHQCHSPPCPRQVCGKQTFTVRSLTDDLKSSSINPEETSDTSVWRLIHDMGFRYKASQRKMYVRKESLDIVAARSALSGHSDGTGRK